MKIAVTGVAGFIGSSIAERLVARGDEVVGVDCFTDYYPRVDKVANLAKLVGSGRFSLIEADLALWDLAPIFDDCELVFHEAAQAGVRASWGSYFSTYVQANVLATQRVLEAAREVGVRKVIYASSSSVYGETDELPMRETSLPRPYSPYGVTKLAAEHLCELYRHNFGLATASLRYFTVYGPRQRPDMGFHRFIAQTLAGKPIAVNGDGEQTRDFTFVSDIVDANLAAAEDGRVGVFNVGGGSRVTLNAVLKTLSDVLGRPLDVERRPAQPGDVTHTWADTTRAHEVLGFSPRVTLAEGLAAQVAWHERRLAAGA